MTNTDKGMAGERQAAAWLRLKGLPVSYRPKRSKYDMEVNGWRVEVKCAPLNTDKRGWFFNIHRHGSLDERQVDFYVFVLQDVPLVAANIYLVVPSPLKYKTVAITFRSLIMKWSRYIDNPDPLRESPPILVRAFSGEVADKDIRKTAA